MTSRRTSGNWRSSRSELNSATGGEKLARSSALERYRGDLVRSGQRENWLAVRNGFCGWVMAA